MRKFGRTRLGGHNIIMKNKRFEDRVKCWDCTEGMVTLLDLCIYLRC
ncbi:hypothetical protein HanXRQr2_Chr09g0387191 [Helianthus annuus]|nr:hypothetical protein HanXRQr2_Chr09g0387191 [Helianthus annuus]KAJ0893050.1 hypothetical protein HanPSC8_Chr09g0373191 [Helianthus annuus]